MSQRSDSGKKGVAREAGLQRNCRTAIVIREVRVILEGQTKCVS